MNSLIQVAVHLPSYLNLFECSRAQTSRTLAGVRIEFAGEGERPLLLAAPPLGLQGLLSRITLSPYSEYSRANFYPWSPFPPRRAPSGPGLTLLAPWQAFVLKSLGRESVRCYWLRLLSVYARARRGPAQDSTPSPIRIPEGARPAECVQVPSASFRTLNPQSQHKSTRNSSRNSEPSFDEPLVLLKERLWHRPFGRASCLSVGC